MRRPELLKGKKLLSETLKADYTLNLTQMDEYLESLAQRGSFDVALLRENGQGYHAAFHSLLEQRKYRVRYTSGDVQDICRLIRHKFQNKRFEEVFNLTILRMGEGFEGSAFVKIQRRRIAAVHFHEGALWP